MSRRLTARLRLLLLYWPFRHVIKSELGDIFYRPGLLISSSIWTRPTFDHSEVKIGLYMYVYFRRRENIERNYNYVFFLIKWHVRLAGLTEQVKVKKKKDNDKIKQKG